MGKYVNGNIVTIGENYYYDDVEMELASLLNVPARSDGQVYRADIAAAPSVNRWAKYKWFRFDSWGFASKAERDSARESVNQGFDLTGALISTTSDVSNIAAKYAQGDAYNGWNYLYPRGSSKNEPYRLYDMEGYNHSALPFVYGFTIPSTHAKDQNPFDVSFRIPMEADDILTYKDFPILQGCYLGVAMVKGNTVVRMTNTQTIANAGLSLQVPVDSLEAGTYTVYPFFCTKQLNFYDGGFIACNVYTVPESSGKTLVLNAGSITIMISAAYSTTADANGYYALTGTISIKNNTGGAMTLSTNYAYLLWGYRQSIGTLDKDEKSMELRNGNAITVNAGATVNIPIVFSNIIADLKNNSKIWVSLQAGKYKQSAPPEQNFNPDLG